MLTKPLLIEKGNESAIMAELSKYKALADKYEKIARELSQELYRLKMEQDKK